MFWFRTLACLSPRRSDSGWDTQLGLYHFFHLYSFWHTSCWFVSVSPIKNFWRLKIRCHVNTEVHVYVLICSFLFHFLLLCIITWQSISSFTFILHLKENDFVAKKVISLNYCKKLIIGKNHEANTKFMSYVYLCFFKRELILVLFRTFVRFALAWLCLFPLPLGVREGLRLVIVALPPLFSYLFITVCTIIACKKKLTGLI